MPDLRYSRHACRLQTVDQSADVKSATMGKKQINKNRVQESVAQTVKPPKHPVESLPLEEKRHLERCTLDYATTSLNHDEFVRKAVEVLEKEHMLVVQNCLNDDEVQVLYECYKDLHQQQAGQRAIGEKDASKRSGTRLYNCLCQLGPACDFYDWKDGTAQAQHCLNPRTTDDFRKAPRKPVWKSITDTFHFRHIARVEVVTSHVGCRAQDWHIDGVHGLTVILPLTDVGVRQGPTELDFGPAFLGLWEGDPKVRARSTGTVRAVMSKGSVLLFNANVSHRGSANIGATDRPILVLDCSLESTCLASGGPRDIWSVQHDNDLSSFGGESVFS